ncbi:RED-like protein N-terminal region-domain-containing protein [Thelephora terrestris]|uniref:RED-like protein N-terminal region-domain-containing protein n=1 Tax=Thelephora terrestris TaxID=56493 RepID=A0A9P6HGZ6_9AGAM|nr:RED-like protein N-terminal region-domain-containing protein [Thelephora terrestris]
MDQDSFRQLLTSGSRTSKASAGNPLGGASRKRSSVPQQSSLKTKPEAGATASFQPRKVKKANPNANYRDRAAERRVGADHEFTHVETLLNDFEERNKGHDKSVIDEQRQYLGGDSEHSVLVKGLDFALLEQNKAKVAAVSSVEDDEALEQAFLGVDGGASADAVESASQPKKKSREDLIRELKEKRGQDKLAENKVVDAGIEEAKKAGKFKPIGFKPIGGNSEGKKRKKEKEGGEKKKKKRKVEELKDKPAEASGSVQPSASPLPATLLRKEKEPDPEPTDLDFDIFAGVEEYTGEIEDESEDEDKRPGVEGSQEPWQDVDPPRKGGWFDEPKSPTPPPKEPTPPPAKEPSEPKEEVEEEPVPMRLAPLASSMSAKDILAVDEAAAKEEKRKARKEKKKKQVELNAQEKVNRDYQKLMAYEQKKSK